MGKLWGTVIAKIDLPHDYAHKNVCKIEGYYYLQFNCFLFLVLD